jgi:hypothetical protein
MERTRGVSISSGTARGGRVTWVPDQESYALTCGAWRIETQFSYRGTHCTVLRHGKIVAYRDSVSLAKQYAAGEYERKERRQ